MVVLATDPLLCAKKRLVAYPEPEDKDISNPFGAVIAIPSVSKEPEVEKLCEAEAMPETDVNAVRVPVVYIVGPATTV
jgi:hypothetical protein